jgi:hypothetical protein
VRRSGNSNAMVSFIHVDQQGRLWVLIRVADAQWNPVTDRTAITDPRATVLNTT